LTYAGFFYVLIAGLIYVDYFYKFTAGFSPFKLPVDVKLFDFVAVVVFLFDSTVEMLFVFSRFNGLVPGFTIGSFISFA
jgi:hypothetical protein